MMNHRSFARAAVLLFAMTAAAQLPAQSGAEEQSASSQSTVQLYSAPDENSPPAGALAEDDTPTPMAETLGPQGEKWHLVRTKSGLVGWLKRSDSDQSKNLERFFKALPREDAAVARTIPDARAGGALPGTIAVPMRLAGRAAVVSALLNGSVNASLIVDTGATVTVISRGLAQRLYLSPSGSMIGYTVGGPIVAPTARLDSIGVGAAVIRGLSVIVHDFSPNPQIEGLLGMDFLGQFHVSLDSRKQILLLSPR
jgi:hypothetical protein